jgi:hypothetical protein
LYDTVIGPATHLEFVNADILAVQRWPEDPAGKSYDAAVVAAGRRAELIEARVSFVTETVFSHESKLELVHTAVDAGYLITLHIVMVPEALAVARVANRVRAGGHTVPEDKIRKPVPAALAAPSLSDWRRRQRHCVRQQPGRETVPGHRHLRTRLRLPASLTGPPGHPRL